MHPTNYAQLPITNPQDTKSRERFYIFEERLRTMEESDNYNLDACDLCLVTYVVIPSKFKVFDFENYNWVIVQRTIRSCIVEILYMHLKKNHIHSWKDLAEYFLNQ